MDTHSPSVKELLIKAGWYEGRRIDVNKYKKCFQEENYPLLGTVRRFLAEFGDLHIEFQRENGEMDLLHFDAIKAARDIDPAWVQKAYANRLKNDNLCVIGQAYSNHIILFMDGDEKVYGGYDDLLYIISASGKGAIEHICLNYLIEEIKQ